MREPSLYVTFFILPIVENVATLFVTVSVYGVYLCINQYLENKYTSAHIKLTASTFFSLSVVQQVCLYVPLTYILPVSVTANTQEFHNTPSPISAKSK